MLADIRLVTSTIAFLFAVYATCASAYGDWKARLARVESAGNAALGVFPLLTISVAVVVRALHSLDLSPAHVSEVASPAISTFLRVMALWGGQHGSMPLWASIMSGFVMIALLRKWGRDRRADAIRRVHPDAAPDLFVELIV